MLIQVLGPVAGALVFAALAWLVVLRPGGAAGRLLEWNAFDDSARRAAKARVEGDAALPPGPASPAGPPPDASRPAARTG
jgi:hypothetical protein